MAGIPALQLLGYKYSFGALILFSACTAVYGGFFALPLRGPLVVKEKLPFPSGTATYETIVAMASAGDLALKRGKYLLNGALVSAAYALCSYFVPQLANPPILQHIGLKEVVRFGWGFDIDPQLFGGGMMCGTKTGISLVYGSLLGFAILGLCVDAACMCRLTPFAGPVVDYSGWTPGPVESYTNGVHAWLLWPGVAMMLCDALTNLWFLISWRKAWSGIKGIIQPSFAECFDARHRINIGQEPGLPSIGCRDLLCFHGRTLVTKAIR